MAKKKTAKEWSPRQQRSRRASKLRDKLKRTGAITDDEREWLDAYEAAKGNVDDIDAPPDDAPPVVEAVPPTDDVAPPPAAADDVAAPPVVAAELPKAPPLPRPPRIERASDDDDGGKKKGGKGWRAKYEDDDSDGREATCKAVADQWHGGLKVLADQIKASGVDPIVDPDRLYGAIILTVDEIMPDHVRLSPRARAVAGTTAIVVHRFIRRKEIAENQKRDSERKEHQQWQTDRNKSRERAEAAEAKMRENADRVASEATASPVNSSAPSSASEPESEAVINGTPSVTIVPDRKPDAITDDGPVF